MQFNRIVDESIEAIASLKGLVSEFESAAKLLVDTFEKGGKVLICGNGGSAADAMHFTTELVCRFEKERRHLPAICLNSSPTDMTAVSNDYTYEDVFSVQLDAFAKSEDLLIVVSTSGVSPNVVRALEKAKSLSLSSIALLGRDGGACRGLASVEIIVPCESTARIQEAQQVLIHCLCGAVDDAFA
jgi:D-sedoheptulose 7-phosphate isomerase